MVPQTCLYRPKLGSASKDRPPISATSHVFGAEIPILELLVVFFDMKLLFCEVVFLRCAQIYEGGLEGV